jgi:hypothetical protein
LNAVTAKEVGIIEYEDDTPTERVTIEPLTNYFVSRIQKDFNEGQSTIGGIFTSTYRHISDEHLEYLHSNAFSGGFDFTHRWDDNRWSIEGSIASTNVSGTAEALLETQTSSRHYFQRPDARHLKVDSLATQLTGYAHNLAISRNHNEHWRGAIGQMALSPNFEANDLGFHRSVDRQMQFIWAQYRENDPGEKIRRYSINFNVWHAINFGKERLSLGGNINANMTLMNYWSFGGGINVQASSNHVTALWGGPAIKADPRRNVWVHIQSDQRKRLSIGGFAYNGGSKEGTYWYGGRPFVTWRPLDNLTITTELNYHRMFDTWANWSGYEAIENEQTGDLEYIMAELHQESLGATIRLDYTITPNLSIQYYGAPYVSAGKYRNHMLVTKPQADKFDDRFEHFNDSEITYNDEDNTWEIDHDNDGVTNFIVDDNDFNYTQFNSNLVIRWEYKTGSSLYLVWSQNGSEYVDFMGHFNFGSDLRNMYKNSNFQNIIMLKFSYLFNI